MALSEKQIEARRSGIGASDAITIMWGEGDEWRALRAEKVDGVRPTFNEGQQLRMDMGHAIEPLTLAMFAKKHHPLKKLPPEHMISWKVDPFFRFTPDGITADTGLPVQCKFHTGDKSIIDLAEFYGPQLLHEMIVMGVKKCYLAVIFGHYGRFQHIEVEYNDEAATAYLQRAMAFKDYMATGVEPEWMVAGVEVPVPRRRDHVWDTNDNRITDLAMGIIQNRTAAETYEKSLADLKLEVPNDAASAKWVGKDGLGVMFKVSSNGAKRLQMIEPAKEEQSSVTLGKSRKKHKVSDAG